MNKSVIRNIVGMLGWFALTFLLTFVITLPWMVQREARQYSSALKPCGLKFEWGDIIRYGIAILLGQCAQIGAMVWMTYIFDI